MGLLAELALRLSTYCACTICVGNLLGLGLNEGTVRRHYYYFSLPQGRPGVRIISSFVPQVRPEKAAKSCSALQANMMQLAALAAVRESRLSGLAHVTDFFSEMPPTNTSRPIAETPAAPHPETGVCPACSDEYGLIDPARHVVMGWSARAACTLAVSVFLDHLGLLDEAWAYDSFVHNYRTQKLDPRFKVRPLGNDSQLSHRHKETSSFKIVRNPYARAVSIYSHQMVSNFSIGPLADHETLFGVEMRSVLGLSRNACLGVVKFITWLRAVRTVRDRHKSLGSFDQHTRLQTTVGEFAGLIKYGTICKLEEDLAGCLHTVSGRTGAKFSADKAAQDPAHHNSAHVSSNGDVAWGDVAAHAWRTFAREAGEKGRQGYRILPTVDYFYLGGPLGREAAGIVADLYAVDFETYGYDPKATSIGDYGLSRLQPARGVTTP